MPADAIRYGTIWPSGHVLTEPLNVLRAGIAGFARLQVVRYRDEARMMESLEKGDIDIASTSEIQSSVPEAGLMYLPYLYADFNHFRRVWTLDASPVALKVQRLIRTRAGLVPLGYSIVGSRDFLFVNGPVTKFDQVRDLRIRVDDASSSASMAEAFGGISKVVNFFQVRGALARGRVDAAENALFNMIELGWVSAARFVSCTEHRYLTNFELAAPDFWKRLTRSRQAELRDGFSAYLGAFADTAILARTAALKHLRRSQGMTVTRIAAGQKDKFRRASEPVVNDFAATHRLGKEVDWIRAAA